MSDVYSITGFFRDWHGLSPFGGFFVLNENKLEGSLIDNWGSSNIAGKLDLDSLNFGKIYHSRNDLIEYSFTKHETGIWIGHYQGNATGRGQASCRINPDWRNLDVTGEPNTPQTNAKDIVDLMIERGLLVPVKDSK